VGIFVFLIGVAHILRVNVCTQTRKIPYFLFLYEKNPKKEQ
jgi:hypothetical protein